MWDLSTQRWRWPNTGRAVPIGRVRRLRERIITDGAGRTSALSKRLTDGDITLSRWQREMRRELHRTHIQMRTLSVGGRQNLTRADYSAVYQRMRDQNGYLAGFASDIAEGKLTPDQIAQRAQWYCAGSMRGTYSEGATASHKKAGYTKKRRSGPNDERTCGTCRSEIEAGWVPIDKPGWVVGETDCMYRDRCEIEYGR